MASNLRVDSIVPSTGTNVAIGTAGGGVNIPGVLTYEDVTNVDSVGVITARSGINVTSGNLKLTGESSGAQLRIGAAQDFQVEHDGNDTFLANITGDLTLQNDANIKFSAKTGGTERLRISSTGNLIFATAGRGIDYSAQTATSASGASTTGEILNHYEEGTWTPTLENAGSTTYSVQVGKFTRIGNIVFITGVIFINNHDNSANSVTGFLGLPYSNGLGKTQVFHVAGNENWDTNYGDSNLTGWLTNGNPDRIRIYHNSGHNLESVSVNDIGDNGELYVTGHYFVS